MCKTEDLVAYLEECDNGTSERELLTQLQATELKLTVVLWYIGQTTPGKTRVNEEMRNMKATPHLPMERIAFHVTPMSHEVFPICFTILLNDAKLAYQFLFKTNVDIDGCGLNFTYSLSLTSAAGKIRKNVTFRMFSQHLLQN